MEYQNNVWIIFQLGIFLVSLEPMEPDGNRSEPKKEVFEMLMAGVQRKRPGFIIIILKQLECFQECVKRKLNYNIVKMAKIPQETKSFFGKGDPMLGRKIEGMDERVLWMDTYRLDRSISISSQNTGLVF